MSELDCGGCRNQGAHRRWCRTQVGYLPSILGPLSEQIEGAGDTIGSNDTGLANQLYAASAGLRAYANARVQGEKP